jgi:hypothetical protein
MVGVTPGLGEAVGRGGTLAGGVGSRTVGRGISVMRSTFARANCQVAASVQPLGQSAPWVVRRTTAAATFPVLLMFDWTLR